MVASGVRLGSAVMVGSGRHWTGTAETAGVFEAKADVVALLAGLGFDANRAQVARAAPAWYHPGRSGVYARDPRPCSPLSARSTLKYWPASTSLGSSAAFEVFSTPCRATRKRGLPRAALQVADLLAVRRDFAFVLDREVAAGEVVKAVLAADKKLISGVSVFDLFEGASLGAGKKSLALEVTLQPTNKTLTDEEIEAVAARVVAEVKKATGGEIRS